MIDGVGRAELALDYIGAALVVDRVGRAKFTGERQASVVNVDGDDRIAAGDLRRHQARQPDRADAEHRNGIARQAGVSELSTAPAPV